VTGRTKLLKKPAEMTRSFRSAAMPGREPVQHVARAKLFQIERDAFLAAIEAVKEPPVSRRPPLSRA
jgi:hypothetical protein